jgi:hypothetical protein
MRPSNTTTLQIRWHRLKRHLRSMTTSARALRDAARFVNGEPPRRRLCGAAARLAA